MSNSRAFSTVDGSVVFSENGVAEWSLAKDDSSGFPTVKPGVAAERILIPDVAHPGNWVDLFAPSGSTVRVPVMLYRRKYKEQEEIMTDERDAVVEKLSWAAAAEPEPLAAYMFSGSEPECLFGRVQLPPYLDNGNTVTLHIYWTPEGPDAGKSGQLIYYAAYPKSAGMGNVAMFQQTQSATIDFTSVTTDAVYGLNWTFPLTNPIHPFMLIGIIKRGDLDSSQKKIKILSVDAEFHVTRT